MHSHSHDHDHGNDHALTSQTRRKTESSIMMEKPASAPTPPSTCEDEACGGKSHYPNPEDDDCASCHSEDLVGGCHMDGIDSKSSKMQAFIFVIALSVHSFLEGLGMASKNTSKSLTLYLISLFTHKWLEAFALGVNVMNAAFSPFYAFCLIFFYAALTPLGIILGIVFEQIAFNGPYAEMVSVCLNGLAVGSFLFVSCIEIIPPEFHKKTRHTVWKFFVVCLGFVLMAAISALHYH